jgi:hypothetical protein
MPYLWQLKTFDRVFSVASTATITAGFSIAFGSPVRAEILGVYLSALDGSAITGGPAVLTLTVANVAGATLTCGAAALGQGSGVSFTNGSPTLSARQFCNEGDVVKATLATGLTSGQNGVVVFVLRTRGV